MNQRALFIGSFAFRERINILTLKSPLGTTSYPVWIDSQETKRALKVTPSPSSSPLYSCLIHIMFDISPMATREHLKSKACSHWNTMVQLHVMVSAYPYWWCWLLVDLISSQNANGHQWRKS